MIKIKAKSLRKDKYVIHPRKAVKHPETQHKHIDGEKFWNKAWKNSAIDDKDTINIADDDLPFQ